MNECTYCPTCRHDNLPENRFCGSCGAALTSSGQLVPHRKHKPAATVRALPAKLGPTGKVLAVGLAALAAEAGLLWLRRRVEGTKRTTPPPAVQDPASEAPGRLTHRTLEVASVWLREGDYESCVLARREEVRSFEAPQLPNGRG